VPRQGTPYICAGTIGLLRRRLVIAAAFEVPRSPGHVDEGDLSEIYPAYLK
jgi:hypothetical protein